jgi:hypothetical protein
MERKLKYHSKSGKEYGIKWKETKETECNEKGRGSGGMGNEEEVEPVFVNVKGAQELIPRNRFRQPM